MDVEECASDTEKLLMGLKINKLGEAREVFYIIEIEDTEHTNRARAKHKRSRSRFRRSRRQVWTDNEPTTITVLERSFPQSACGSWRIWTILIILQQPLLLQ
ncbi:hypothetical protein EVAR_79830_1 [Eumeta japonica]|uniref:Uncharacterized protein n=1 Tax=Eumeta variegata TaxID=151549 RepID=A0A4C1WRM0_EUMVA|nr:hypothetical protein EVAR_79830_1 [Eumeta japonica]